ncbi:UDP-glycosyltransferase 90A1-like [Lycium barbarum]|uniref:UDP-glycosyltransferase 90A1-like n=1 Tax=Lycium barbarum TaxID=112863 RepID=UPI00293E50C4|nr:UDP-glycosyltransferase 90A1-like [Lycium barbarum]
MASPPTTCIHVVLFPFMSKGHTIPIFDLARLLLNRNISITIFTTPVNHPFFSKSLSDTNINIIEIPFPENIEGIPPGVESTDKLPSMSLFPLFANATKLMQPHFEQALESLLPVTFMITDGFLGWTLDSANKFGIPRLVYYGMNSFSSALSLSAMPIVQTQLSDDELFEVPDFPWIKLTRNDFDLHFRDPEPKGPFFDFTMGAAISTSKSYGLLVNSFYELESVYVEHCNRISTPKLWCVGPFCAVHEPPKEQQKRLDKPSYIKWLDGMLEQGKSVLYVAFGTQAEISFEQYREITNGLEKSEVNFLWVVRKSIDDVNEGFENRVKTRGLVVTEWVDQREILNHGSVQAFLSHCGWNSVIESICAKVPIVAWPMMAEQHLNARMVVEEIKIGLRVETCDGSVRGFVKCEGLEKPIRELMEGEKGKEARKKVEEIGEAAINAVKEGGSSWKMLNELIHELAATRQV